MDSKNLLTFLLEMESMASVLLDIKLAMDNFF